MKTEIKKIDNANRQIKIELNGERVKDKFEEVFKKIGQEAKIKGFRPGHAPRDVLEKAYSSVAHEQVLKELIPELYEEALAKEKIDSVDYPQISDVKLERDHISFTAKVEVHPEIEIKNYKGIKLVYTAPAVSEDEIKRYLDSVKESRKLDTLDDAFAKSMGYPSLDVLRKTIERQLALQKDNAQHQQLEKSLIEQLGKGLDVKLPQAMVNRQIEETLRQTKMDLIMRGLPREKVDAEDAAMRKEIEPRAREHVQTYLLLSAVAKKENIPVNDAMPRQVMEFLFREANWEVK